MSAPRNLSALAQEYTRLRAGLIAEFPELADDVQALADTLDGISDASDVVIRYVRSSREDALMASVLTGFIKDNQARKARLEARAERKREVALRLMEAMGERKIERPDLTVHVATGRSAVRITDPDALPDAFCRFSREPDKARIKAELEAFGEVPGATLSNPEPQLKVSAR